MTASVGFKMVEFESQSNNTIEYQFQVDETSDPDKQLYDVIIGNDLLYNMGINILFKERQIQWNDDKIPMKEMGSCQDRDMCDMLHSMYTDSFSLKIIFIKISYINYCIGHLSANIYNDILRQ